VTRQMTLEFVELLCNHLTQQCKSINKKTI
jgi:hypothetical protein